MPSIRFPLIWCLLAALTACGGNNDAPSQPAVENRIVLAKSNNDSYQEVRHIVLRGTDQEIGAAIARISNDFYQAQPKVLTLQEKMNRNTYIQQHFPILAERQKGVSGYYGWSDSDLHDSSALWYDIGPGACSAIYFPKSTTASGHSLQARNMEFYTVTFDEFTGHPAGTGNMLFSRNFILEMYPKNGYATLVAGTFDLLNGAFDGFNEHGLSMSGLVDQNLKPPLVLSDWNNAAGLSYLQMFRAVLEGARTVEEAKQIVSNLKVYFPMDGMHFLIGDRNGNSMILEFSADDLSPIFLMQQPGSPTIVTNHSVKNTPTVDKFPKIDPTKPYDTYYRYLRLYNYLQATQTQKYTLDDSLFAMSLVYGYADDSSEGAEQPFPLRTVWSLVMDLDDLSMKIKFYTRDNTELKIPLFSDYYTFKLRR